MPTLAIDGKTITVSEGTTVLQACEMAGSPLPFYCYHPGLSIAGNCRICLVEIEKNPKLMIGCHTKASEGMVVHTNSKKVLEGRQHVLEFILANHPLDCPVCDQAGECWLQDYYMAYGLYDPKFNEAKVKKSKKATQIGPHVMLDMERCILCSRCVRFTDEVTKTKELGIFNRGDRSELGVHPGKALDNHYSGCVVDICPVGALTDKDFRFKCRVWYLSSAKSICPGCSMGCNTYIHTNRERKSRPHVAGGERVMRLKPRYNPNVNQWWMCDEGRYGYHSIDKDRLTQVQFRRNGILCNSYWNEAMSEISDEITRLSDANNNDRVAVLFSSDQPNEDLYVGYRIFSGLGVKRLAVQKPCRIGISDDLLMKADRSANANGAKAIGLSFDAAGIIEKAKKGEISLLYICGVDLVDEYGQDTIEHLRQKVKMIVFQGSNINKSYDIAHILLPTASYAERPGTFTNCQGRVQKFEASCDMLPDSKPDWQIFFDLAVLQDMPWIFSSAESIFNNLASHVKAFSGMSYESLGEFGAVIKTQ
jgi:NADH-quinone oxidoreductase subunit G